jgi:importin subunit alpha-1
VKIGSGDELLNAMVEIRKMLTVKGASNVMKQIILFMSDSSNPALQLEAGWILTNMLSGDSFITNSIVDKNPFGGIYTMLQSENKSVQEQALWIVGNLAGDSSKYRDSMLNLNFFPILISVC